MQIKLNEDMKAFILKQNDHYSNIPTNPSNPWNFWHNMFWSKVCSDMLSEDVELSKQQIEIINQEYNKVKNEREKRDNGEWM